MLRRYRAGGFKTAARWGMMRSMSSAHKGDETTGDRAGRENARRVAIGILAAVALLFAVLNFEDVKVDLLFGSVTMPLVIVIAACLLIGGLIGAYVGRRGQRGRRT
jgi:uncharacterized integral membrane protein